MARWHPFLTAIACGVGASTIIAVAQDTATSGRPARDRAGERTAVQAQGTGKISGHVVAADTGRPVRLARVLLTSTDTPNGRSAQTDEQGAFEFTGLAAGRYSLTASKSGFVNLSYGQRRPRQAGTPLQLADGQQLSGVDFNLPRGSVIAGHVYDEAGEPLVGAMVQVYRYQYAQGHRQLMPAGGGTTDDLGAFRVWGLNPGDHYLSATARNLNFGGAGLIGGMTPGFATAIVGGRGGNATFVGPGAGAVIGAGGPITIGANAVEAQAYAPTYFPGVASPAEAQAITLGLGSEVSSVNFSVQLVRTARINGRLAMSDGSAIAAGNLTLTADGVVGRGPGMNYGARVASDGAFTIANVPPGRYTLRARGGSPDAPQFAVQTVTVADGENQTVAIVLSPGATITGNVTFQSSNGTAVPDSNQVRIVAPTTDVSVPGPSPVARVDRDGHFSLNGVSAGSHWIRPQNTMRGWTLKSVVIDGRETIDTPLEVRSGQTITAASLVFTDRLSEVNGTLTDGRRMPVIDYTVLAFPVDQSLWRPEARQIMTARPDQNGRFQIRGLPPGDYFLAPIDPVEQGEWFEPAFLEEHRSGAAQLSLGEGDVKTQDFTLREQ